MHVACFAIFMCSLDIPARKESNTDRNILVNVLQVVIYLAFVANIKHETWEKNVLQVNSYTLKQFC